MGNVYSRGVFGKNYGWIVINIGAFSLFMGALFYQYILDMQPCFLCIQQRTLIFSIWVISIIGATLGVKKHYSPSIKLTVIDLFLVALVMLSAVYAYDISSAHMDMASAGEFGFMFSTCEGGSPFPSFLPLDTLSPGLFGVMASCDGDVAEALGLKMPVYVQAFSVLVMAICCAKFLLAFDVKK